MNILIHAKGEFLYTFLTVAVYDKEKVNSKELLGFMNKAKELNEKRFCNAYLLSEFMKINLNKQTLVTLRVFNIFYLVQKIMKRT